MNSYPCYCSVVSPSSAAHAHRARLPSGGRNYGACWLHRLGINQRRAPSQPTLHRLFKGLDCAALERAMTRWAEQVLKRG